MQWPHLIDNSLKAHYLYQRDVRYVVKEGRVVIVDEFTGRLMEGRQWSDGLHQAVEAKEGVKIKEETQTLATITLQNFFKLYDKICGMTGTAMTEANEFWKIYKLDVIAIPTNRPLQRIEHPDVIYRTEREKYIAVADEIERMNKWDVLTVKGEDGELWGLIQKEVDNTVTFQPKESKQRDVIERSRIKSIERRGRPVLVGTVSIEKSERISKLLEQRGIKHEVLNAKHHKREAEIVAQAGRMGAVTIATNMAGRGTDIVLGGNAETMAWAMLQDKYATRLDVPREEWDALVEEIEVRENMKPEGEEVKGLNGLHVIGTERHDARRIDLQLRGRTGRQGDPGSSRFFLCLEDDLMRIFAGEWVKSILDRLGMQEGERIESRMVTRRIEAAQKKVEERNFEVRKNLLEYDEVMDEQRKRVYGYRQRILNGANGRELILTMVREQIEHYVDELLDRDFGVASFASFASTRLSTPLEAREFRGMDFNAAENYAKDLAERAAESDIQAQIDECLPDSSDEEDDATADWNWEALAKFASTRFVAGTRDRDLKRIGRDNVAEHLYELAHAAILKVDLSEGSVFLEDDFGVKALIGWVRNKFGIELSLDEVRHLEPEQFKDLVFERAEAMYDEKESEYPVMAGLYKFTSAGGAGGSAGRIDREGLVQWARERFDVELDLDDLKHKQRDEIRALLVEHSRAHQQQAGSTLTLVKQKVDALFRGEGRTAGAAAGGNGAMTSLSDWLRQTLKFELPPEDIAALDRDELEEKLLGAVEDRFHPEMRRMERGVLLSIVDTAWKDHLLTMDYLRSAVSLKGYAQLDPKVEYKREGMRLFEAMWQSIGERSTDLVFRMEQLDEGFVRDTWNNAKAVHDEAQSARELAQQQQEMYDSGGGDGKIEPIRNRGRQVGRNDPCPCGSGKKYKSCCMRKGLV
jgi:preprotein translocase subunit SecA